MGQCAAYLFKRLFFIWFVAFSVAPAFAQEGAPVQNAVLEGIQFSTDNGEKASEKVVTCYFIFRDKPSNYYSEVKKKPLRLVFEFYDTEQGTSPIQQVQETPFSGFKVEQIKVDVNKEVKGLKPDYRDVVRVSFSADAEPKFQVMDEYNNVSFKYKWPTDPSKINEYTVQDNTGLIVGISIGTAALLGGGAAAFLLLNKPPPPGPLDISDRPGRTR